MFPPRGIQSFGFWRTWGTRTHALGDSEVNSSWWKAELTQYLSRSKRHFFWLGKSSGLAKFGCLSTSENLTILSFFIFDKILGKHRFLVHQMPSRGAQLSQATV